MPTPRRLQVSLEATSYYHCISRCVRRAFLCGVDHCSTRSFDHRKAWLIDRMQELASIFAVDLCAYAVLGNHFHVVLRIDRARALQWSDEEVVARYGRLFRQIAARWPALSENERARRAEQWRTRLWDLSWFMRCLNESIARRANREDGCTGRFWEGRFRSQALLDEGAVLTCMSYVDLNPIRAGIAKTLEGGEFTSIRERLRAVTTRSKVASRRAPQLLPFDGDEPREQGHSFECLPMRLTDYVALLELTGRSIREERSGEEELSPELEAALRRVGLEPSGFIPGVREFGRTFFGMVGRMHRIEVESARRGYVRRMGMRAAQRLYRPNAA